MAGHPVDLHVGARLRTLRLGRNLSQSELAGKVGLTFQQLQKYEKGTNRVSASKLFEFSQILDTSVQEFFAGIPSDEESDLAVDKMPLLSKLDCEILALVGQLDGHLKQGIRGVLQALVSQRRDNEQVHSQVASYDA